ncbi:MAG: DUF4974 domain-containing protein [Bacteroidales bacterium]|nr:DUF4974 domain-containing protein [Bacteroidales bacterium]
MNKEKCLDLFERYLLNQASDEEVASLYSFIQNDPDLNRWLENEIKNSSPEIDEKVKKRMLNHIQSQINEEKKTKRIRSQTKQSNKYSLRWIVNVAAILLPVVLMVGVYFYSQTQEVDYLTVSAGMGEKAGLSLPDGSKISINSGSKVIYSTAYNKEERILELHGEGYFEISPNPSKPFIVQCGDIKVKVLGTVFGINAYDDDSTISVVLNSGKVEFISPRESLIMQPNDRVTYNRDTQQIHTEKVNAEDYMDWRQNRIRFENETLEHIMKVISRMHNTDIVFDDTQLAQQKFTGTINNVSVQSALKALSLTAPIRYEVRNGVITLFEDKEAVQYFK